MTKQLTLIDTPVARRLDERTRAVGREGIARARAALTAGLHAAPLPGRGSDPPPPAATDRPPPATRRPSAAGRRAGRRPAGGDTDRAAA